jgi:hypothetical protein
LQKLWKNGWASYCLLNLEGKRGKFMPNVLGVAAQTFDLTQFSPKDIKPIGNDLAFLLTGSHEQLLDSPLSQIDAPHNSASLSCGSDHQSWQPSGGPVTFTLYGNVAATITVVHESSIFGKNSNGNDVVYHDGFSDFKPTASMSMQNSMHWGGTADASSAATYLRRCRSAKIPLESAASA